MGIWESLISPISTLVHDVLNRVLPPEKMSEKDRGDLEAAINNELLKADASEIDAKMKVLVTELSGNWLQKSWRPILMLCIVGIVANNYILFPYIQLFLPGKALILELPDRLWSLLQIGVGGYIAGRSAEKIADTLKK